MASNSFVQKGAFVTMCLAGLAFGVNAGVVHVDIDDTSLLNGVQIDLDQNGAADFLFFYSDIDTFGQVCNAFPYAGGRAVGTQGPGGLFTDGLGPGVTIPGAVTWSIEGNFMIWVDQGGFAQGDWAAQGTERAVALRISKPDGLHYGWARVRNISGVTGMYLRDWAYETSPNTPIVTPIIGDVDLSGHVDVDDLFEVINHWGSCVPTGCAADLDGDGAVNVDDLFLVINHWG